MTPSETSTPLQLDTRGKMRQPWFYIPTTYFAEGLPYIIVNSASVIMYKKMGIPNSLIGLTSFLYLPWVIKMLWGPAVDLYATKRKWILATQLLMAISFMLVAAGMQTSMFFAISLVCFTLMAFISATHDIAVDGFYMLALPEDKQAFFVGIRSTFYRLAMIFGSGVLVIVAGTIETTTGNIPQSWTTVLGIAGAIMLVLFLFHKFYLPFPATDGTHEKKDEGVPFIKVFKAYFKQGRILAIIAFILLYRFGEAMLVKMSSPFLLDNAAAGGLGLSTQTVGSVYGTFGVLSLVAGGICGGMLISKFGLRKCIWPMAVALNAPDLVYVYMAAAKPALPFVYALVCVEQFGYGVGFTAFTVYLMYTSKGEYKTSHFAISTGIMALGMMVPGLVSGYVQEALGYLNFFVVVCVATLPGMAAIFFIPMEESKAETAIGK
jgi:PAT family beta-lactamase induction signal transducer AmpG